MDNQSRRSFLKSIAPIAALPICGLPIAPSHATASPLGLTNRIEAEVIAAGPHEPWPTAVVGLCLGCTNSEPMFQFLPGTLKFIGALRRFDDDGKLLQYYKFSYREGSWRDFRSGTSEYVARDLRMLYPDGDSPSELRLTVKGEVC